MTTRWNNESYPEGLLRTSKYFHPGQETKQLINDLLDENASFAVLSCEYCHEVFIMKWNKSGGMFYNVLLSQDIMEAHYEKECLLKPKEETI